MNLIDALNWRYATKRMNGRKIDAQKLHNILEATRLSVSSIGLQPYSVQIHPIAFNQPQITEASHLLIFAAWDEVTEARFEEFTQDTAEQRGLPLEKVQEQFAGYKKNILSRPADVNHQWAARQAYIALGTAVAAAALEKVDATPMEGFNSDQLDELLGLKERGLKSYAMLTLGFRDESNDWLVNQKKVRRPKEKLFVELV
jgi:nitroreductase/dihydropteridine reductase